VPSADSLLAVTCLLCLRSWDRILFVGWFIVCYLVKGDRPVVLIFQAVYLGKRCAGSLYVIILLLLRSCVHTFAFLHMYVRTYVGRYVHA